jgi:hypothetical protein
MFSKRSQMEVLGLTVVILLMAVAMLFVVNKMINRPVSDARQSYLNDEIAANMLNSLLKTSTGGDCRGADFTELFQDCAAYFSMGGSIRCKPDDIPSCDYLIDKINNTILRNMTVKWRIHHVFLAQVDGQKNPLLEFSYNCSLEDVGVPKWSPIPTDVGTLMIGFKICS